MASLRVHTPELGRTQVFKKPPKKRNLEKPLNGTQSLISVQELSSNPIQPKKKVVIER